MASTFVDKALHDCIERCLLAAQHRRYAYFTAELLLQCMLDDDDVKRAVRASGGKLTVLRRLLKSELADALTLAEDAPEDARPQASAGFVQTLERAAAHVASCGRKDKALHCLDVLVQMFAEEDGVAAHCMQRAGMTRLSLLEWIASLADADGEGGSCPGCQGEEAGEEAQTPEQAIAPWAENLTELAREGKIDPLVGRADELKRIEEILCRKTKSNPLLVGEPGVGKTAIVYGLALAIAEKRVSPALAGRQIWSLKLGAMLAGTSMRGEFEKRCQALVSAMKAMPGAILFIDDIHAVVGAGSGKSGEDAASFLKEPLSRGLFPCIGATTYEEYRQGFEKSRTFARRFQRVDVSEPTAEETLEIVKGLRPAFEKFHGVAFTEEALACAVELSRRFLTSSRHPDSAIDVIDEAGARRRTAAAGAEGPVDRAEIEGVVGRMARVPVAAVTTDDTDKLKGLEAGLKGVIFGQDPAIESVVRAVKLSRSGLGRPASPVGSFLFAGPTGVGKTELARQLAEQLGMACARFDMSEYSERVTVSRLLGAPPGYVGYEKGGELTEAVVKNPHSVILLDELEKAHPDIYNVLLQVMDRGKLTDANGRTADFTNTILVMTTNAGAAEMSSKSIGFAQNFAFGDPEAAIRKAFAPEFRNRLDAVIRFAPLGRPELERVAGKFLAELSAQLEGKNVKACFTGGLKDWLVEHGSDPAMGARPMGRLIRETVRTLLADELLFGRLKDGGEVTVDVGGDGKPVLALVRPA